MAKSPTSVTQDSVRAAAIDEVNAKVSEEVSRRKRTVRIFPSSTFEESLEFAGALYSVGSGQQVRRLTLFDHIGKAPESGPSRTIISNASKYGLIRGSAASDFLELTPDGALAANEEAAARERRRAQVRLGIEGVEPFKQLYDHFVGNKLPARAVLIDAAKEYQVPSGTAEEAVDIFIVNLRFLGLLTTLSGADRIISVEHLLDSLPSSSVQQTFQTETVAHDATSADRQVVTAEHASFDNTCFYIAPIGDEGSEQRKHSDLFLGSFVEPAMETFGLRIVRADAIDRPGVITKQIIEYIVRARLVIVDLSYHNPNVFYELAIRHMMKLPIVQIARAADKIPFDINQMRTIRIDTTDIFALVPKIDAYRSEIATHVRRALENPDSVDTPINTYFPSMQVTLN